jgi:hypothetical protein
MRYYIHYYIYQLTIGIDISMYVYIYRGTPIINVTKIPYKPLKWIFSMDCPL